MKHSAKINNGCLNIFKFLELLYNDQADYNSVINIFKEDIEKERENYEYKKLNNLVQVVLNKYINALKIFGVKIKKEKNKYKLDSSLYSLHYTLNELRALNIIQNISKNIPDNDINENISILMGNILLRMNSYDKSTFSQLYSDKDFSFYYKDLKDQIDNCKKYCKDNSQLDITYLHKNKEKRCQCQANEIIYSMKTAFLSVYDIHKKENMEIPLPNILSILELPRRATAKQGTMTVVYKLKGRLVKTYKLKENEKLGSQKEDEIVIINSGEPMEKLFSRLLRYSELCEIISPKYIRTKMINLLNETLKLYEK